eukprot:gene6509-6736_t
MHTAAVVNELTREMGKVLEAHPINKQRLARGESPANMVLLRGCGSRINVASFEQLHGMKACLVAPTKIIAGLGLSFDIASLDAPGATGSYDSHFASKAAVATAALVNGGFDFALVHVKAVDDTGHDRMLTMKVEQAVAAMGGTRQQDLRRQYVNSKIPLPDVKGPMPPIQELLLQAEQQQQRRTAAAQGIPFPLNQPRQPQQQQHDPWTDGSSQDEEDVPQHPVHSAVNAMDLSHGSWLEAWPQMTVGDGVCAFDELSAARGGLGRFTGASIMPLLKEFAGRQIGSCALTVPADC